MLAAEIDIRKCFTTYVSFLHKKVMAPVLEVLRQVIAFIKESTWAHYFHLCTFVTHGTLERASPFHWIEARNIKEVHSKLVALTGFLSVSEATASLRTINEDLKQTRRPHKSKFLVH